MSRDTWIMIGVAIAIVGAVTLVLAVRMVFRLVTVKRMLGELGTGGKWAFWGAIAYTIFPIDLLPDPIYLDDMAVLGGALYYLTKLLRKRGTLDAALPHARRAAEVIGRQRARRG
jgi:uncharacterized membrane protein YkvA (DUF1232 family)